MLITFFISNVAPSVAVSVSGVDGATAGSSQTLTCSVAVSGVDLSELATVTLAMYTWFRGDGVVQAASTSSQYMIPSGSLGVSNAGDVYICQVAISASYWDVSGSFGGSGSGTLSVNSKSKWLTNLYYRVNFLRYIGSYVIFVSFSTI